MAVTHNFRGAFNGFNREDVVHYIEPLASIRIEPKMRVARDSYLPCPKLWSLSAGLWLRRAKRSTIASEIRSVRECTASAIIAAEEPSTPATNLKMTSRILITAPQIVILKISFSLCIGFFFLNKDSYFFI